MIRNNFNLVIFSPLFQLVICSFALLHVRRNILVIADLVESFGEIKDVAKHNYTKQLLLGIRQKINADYPTSREGRFEYPNCRFGGNGRKDFLNNCIQNYSEDIPIYSQRLSMNWNQLGNTIGMLIEDISCAQLIGAHFLAIGEVADHTRTIGHNLPLVIVHQKSAENYSAALQQLDKQCNPRAWPFAWDPSKQNVPLTRGNENFAIIRRVINHAVCTPAKAQLPSNISLNNHSHIYANNISTDTVYPIVSDVAIHYRCKDDDNVRFRYMGLMPISYVVSLINKDAKYIYIHTEEKHHDHHRRCKKIVRALFDDIVTTFPHAYVLVFEGGNMLLSMYDLINSRLATICSSSTFCWHLAFGKTSGDVFIPPIYYPGGFRFNYSHWHYMTVLPIWEWSDRTYANTTSMINILRNETLFLRYKLGSISRDEVY